MTILCPGLGRLLLPSHAPSVHDTSTAKVGVENTYEQSMQMDPIHTLPT